MKKVIAISQQKGGAGKTTIAAHLAITFREKGLKVALLDVDPQGSLSSWYAARKRFSKASNKKNNISFVSLSSLWSLRAEIERARAENDIVIIDCPPHTKSESRVAVREADLVVIPMQPSPADLWATTSTLELALKENAHTFVVLNRIISNTSIARQFLNDLPESHVIGTLGNRVIFASAMAEGKSVTEVDSSCKAAYELRQLSASILEKINSRESTKEVDEAKSAKKPVKRRKKAKAPAAKKPEVAA